MLPLNSCIFSSCRVVSLLQTSEHAGVLRFCMQGYKPPNAQASEYQTIPMSKIEDFGVHANQYYPLDVSFFKSSLDSHMLDMLWNKWAPSRLSASASADVNACDNAHRCAPAVLFVGAQMPACNACRYWVNTLAASPLINTRELTSGQISDIGAPAVRQFVSAGCHPQQQGCRSLAYAAALPCLALSRACLHGTLHTLPMGNHQKLLTHDAQQRRSWRRRMLSWRTQGGWDASPRPLRRRARTTRSCPS
jgi:hypothetical protein